MESLKKNGAVYFGVTGGAAALVASCVTECETVCYEDLAPSRFAYPRRRHAGVVLVDSLGNDLYELGRNAVRSQAGIKAI
jgi:fumarate hydratase subunit beta